jgi:hypothetical protein
LPDNAFRFSASRKSYQSSCNSPQPQVDDPSNSRSYPSASSAEASATLRTSVCATPVRAAIFAASDSVIPVVLP